LRRGRGSQTFTSSTEYKVHSPGTPLSARAFHAPQTGDRSRRRGPARFLTPGTSPGWAWPATRRPDVNSQSAKPSSPTFSHSPVWQAGRETVRADTPPRPSAKSQQALRIARGPVHRRRRKKAVACGLSTLAARGKCATSRSRHTVSSLQADPRQAPVRPQFGRTFGRADDVGEKHGR